MSSPPDTTSPPGGPNPQLRTIVSLVLFVHLFAVGLAVLTNSDSGAPDLLRNVRDRTPGMDAYLTQLWLNRPYDYHLMNDQPLDYDHHLEATIHYDDGRKDEVVTLPAVDKPGERPEHYQWPTERWQRYQQLAWYVARLKSLADTPGAGELDEQRKVLLPGAIGAGLLRQHPGANSVALKCIFHRAIRRDELLGGDAKERNPNDAQYFETVSDVTVLLVDGRPEIFENQPLLEVAPLRKRAAGSAATSAGTAPPPSEDN